MWRMLSSQKGAERVLLALALSCLWIQTCAFSSAVVGGGLRPAKATVLSRRGAEGLRMPLLSRRGADGPTMQLRPEDSPQQTEGQGAKSLRTSAMPPTALGAEAMTAEATGVDGVVAEGLGVEGLGSLKGHSSGSEVALGLWEARGMVFLAAALCGSNFGALKILQKSLDPATLLSARFMLASAVMTPLIMKGKRKALWAGFDSGLWLAGGYIVQAMALQTIPAATTAFLGSLTTVVCPFVEKFTGQKVGRRGWAAAALAVLGAAFLECSGSSSPGLSDGWALLVPVAFGIFFHKTHEAMKEFPDQALPITGMQLTAVALSGILWSVLQAHGYPAEDVTKLWELMHDVNFDLAMVWVAVVATAFAIALETVAMGILPSSETAVIYSSEPLWATGFAAVMLGEEIGKNTIIGGSHIVAACVGSVTNFSAIKKDFFKLRKQSRRATKRRQKADSKQKSNSKTIVR